MTYKVEVQADSTGTWAGNGLDRGALRLSVRLAFDTVEDAEQYARDLTGRWMAVRYWYVVNEVGTVVQSSRPEETTP